MNPEIKPIIEIARPGDFQSIADIYNVYVELRNSTMDQELKSAEDIAGWINKFNARERLYVLKTNEEVIGWGIIKKYSDREGYRYACETAVYLRKDMLGKGYGTFLKKFIILQCKSLNYHHLVAKIWASNEGSIKYNLNLGYTIVGTQKEIGFSNGKWLDVVIMQLILS